MPRPQPDSSLPILLNAIKNTSDEVPNEMFRPLSEVYLGDKILSFGYDIEWRKVIITELTALTAEETEEVVQFINAALDEEFSEYLDPLFCQWETASIEELENCLVSRERIHLFLTVLRTLMDESSIIILAALPRYDVELKKAIPALRKKKTLKKKILRHAQKLPAEGRESHWWFSWALTTP